MLRPLPTVLLEEIFPGIEKEPISVQDYGYTLGNMPLSDLAQLCRLVRRVNPKVIFEIGTFEGMTTLQMALNSSAEVFTLDLPPDGERLVQDAGLDVYPQRPGACFAGTPYAVRIRQLYGDSRTFDFSPWLGKVDLVLVDACHHYEYVRRDTENALRLLTPTGVIAWHDYASYAPGVVQALEEAQEALPLVHVADTCLALYLAERQQTDCWQFEWVRRGTLEELQSSLDRLQAEYDELQGNFTQLQAQFDDLQHWHQEFQTQHDQLKARHEQLQVQHEQLKKQLHAANAQCEEVRTHAAESQVQCDKLKADYDASALRYRDLKTRYDELEVRHAPFTHLRGILKELPRAVARAVRRRLPG